MMETVGADDDIKCIVFKGKAFAVSDNEGGILYILCICLFYHGRSQIQSGIFLVWIFF